MDAAAIAAWIDGDPDPADRRALAGLLARAERGDGPAAAELAALFARPLAFGTAGLRGPLRPGPAGMNTAVVRRAAAGLGTWLLARIGPGPDRPSVVIGHDARHGSESFALDSARVLTAAGLRAVLLPPRVATPLLAFAVRHLDADAGVMVTASHNPAGDNGYKVYLGARAAESAAGAGAQLVSPADAEIEAAIARSRPAVAIALDDGWQRCPETVLDAYVTAAARAVAGAGRTAGATGTATAHATAHVGAGGVDGSATDSGDPVIAYTPLHGVGAAPLCAVFARVGLPFPVIVAEQEHPDPDFPTVPYPNPEEPGALDLALDLGERIGADLVIANDPDADRCAVAVGRRVLTGDELGLLLADDALRRAPRTVLTTVATTIVSSRALRALATARGVEYRETLTGFKWLMRARAELVFAYEEALGYAVAPDLVRDKDGITAAAAVAGIAVAQRRRGRTLLDRLDDLAREIGVFRTAQVSVRLAAGGTGTEGAGNSPTGARPTGPAAFMAALRARPPRSVGSVPVTGLTDLAEPAAAELTAAEPGPEHGGRPRSADVIILTLAGGGRLVARPSGTEPKIKIYLETSVPVPPGADVAAARRQADAALAALRAGAEALARSAH